MMNGLAAALQYPYSLPGHHDVSTTMTYTHALNRGPAAVPSPAERMFQA